MCLAERSGALAYIYSSTDLSDRVKPAMEALGVRSLVAAPSSKICGIDGRAGSSRRNWMTATSAASAQFFPAQEERKCSAGSENVSALDARGHFRACSDGHSSDRSKLALASLVSGLASVQSALAVSYDDVVGAAQEAATSGADSFGLEVPAVDTSSLTDFLSSNPLVLLGGGAIVALPLLFAAIFKKTEGYGTVSATQAFAELGDKELNSQLLDIRIGDDAKSEGKPDLKAYKKKVIQLPYTSEPEEYVSKVLKKFKDAEATTIYVLDRFDGNSLNVAKLLANGGFKGAYAIKDGAEGPSGWQTSELPWQVPQKFSINLGGFRELLSTADTGNLLPTTLGVAAAAGVGLVVFSEAETALQLLGSAALVQLFVKKFLFAADRKKTLEELRTFLDTKVAPAEIVEELKEIADVLLPKYEAVEAATVNGAALVENTVADVAAKVETAADETVAKVETAADETGAKVETAADETVAKAETAADETAAKVETDSPTLAVETATPAEPTAEEQVDVDPTLNGPTELPRTGKPLSPYAQYPGLQPPSSPSPARP